MSKGTTPRAVRIDDALWNAAKAATAANGDSLSDVIRQALQKYVAAHDQESERSSSD